MILIRHVSAVCLTCFKIRTAPFSLHSVGVPYICINKQHRNFQVHVKSLTRHHMCEKTHLKAWSSPIYSLTLFCNAVLDVFFTSCRILALICSFSDQHPLKIPTNLVIIMKTAAMLHIFTLDEHPCWYQPSTYLYIQIISNICITDFTPPSANTRYITSDGLTLKLLKWRWKSVFLCKHFVQKELTDFLQYLNQNLNLYCHCTGTKKLSVLTHSVQRKNKKRTNFSRNSICTKLQEEIIILKMKTEKKTKIL